MRWLLLLPALLAIFGAWFAVRWYVGNTIAEYAPDVTEGGLDMARMAVRWAPGDPLVHWRLGSLEEKVFSAENMAAAVNEYQTAVRLSPNDYRYWMELGRALEANGDRENGEKALRRAVELAPAYSHPRWQFGNLLLREGKFGEAFDQLGRAAESDNEMRRPVFDLAMQVFDGDVNEVVKEACTSPAARLQFVIYLVGTEKYDDARRILGTVSSAERRAHTELDRDLQESLIREKQFRAVLGLLREDHPDTDLPAPEHFWNGGFETGLALTGANNFNWILESRGAVQVAIDSHGHSGQKSLRLVFKATRSLDKIPVSQTVVVEPGTQYHFECYLRTDDLISASTPVLVVLDAVDSATLAASSPIPTGTNGWQRVNFDFTTKPKHDGIIVGFNRPPCTGDAQICPILGTVWYDDFNIQRVGSPGPPGGDGAGAKR
ncbi:MAG: hypothetical protein QOE96_1498 [Blastocatellia bacterium]|nr:hypothetical protein [Blastocatellia bacterium]